jgi:uncharacterized membrane protein YgcG
MLKIFIFLTSFLIITSKWTPMELAKRQSPTTSIIDPDKYIADRKATQIDLHLKDLQKTIGHEVKLYIISEMDSIYNIEAFTNDLTYYIFNKDAERDKNSIFILFSINDRKMRVRTGEIPRRTLTDSICVYYLDSLKENLRAGEYETAIADLLYKISKKFTDPDPWEGLKIFLHTYLGTIIFWCIIALVLLFSNKSLDKSAEEKLKRIKEICERNKSKKHFIESSCIICLEKFDTETNVELNELKEKQQESSSDDTLRELVKTPQEALSSKNIEKEFPEEESKEYPDEESKEYLEEAKAAKNKLINKPSNKSKQDNTKSNVFKATLECGHTFHSNCISDWMTKQNKCPICREKIDKEEDNTKPLAEDLITVHTSYHPSFSSLRFDYTNDSLAWRFISNSNNRHASDGSSWGDSSGGGSSDW